MRGVRSGRERACVRAAAPAHLTGTLLAHQPARHRLGRSVLLQAETLDVGVGGDAVQHVRRAHLLDLDRRRRRHTRLRAWPRRRPCGFKGASITDALRVTLELTAGPDRPTAGDTTEVLGSAHS